MINTRVVPQQLGGSAVDCPCDLCLRPDFLRSNCERNGQNTITDRAKSSYENLLGIQAGEIHLRVGSMLDRISEVLKYVQYAQELSESGLASSRRSGLRRVQFEKTHRPLDKYLMRSQLYTLLAIVLTLTTSSCAKEPKTKTRTNLTYESFQLDVFDTSETYSNLIAINGSGHVLGYREVQARGVYTNEYFFDDGEKTTKIPGLEGYTNTEPIAISDDKWVAGFASRPMGSVGRRNGWDRLGR